MFVDWLEWVLNILIRPAWDPPCVLEMWNTDGPDVKLNDSVLSLLILDSVPLLQNTKNMISVSRA